MIAMMLKTVGAALPPRPLCARHVVRDPVRSFCLQLPIPEDPSPSG